MPSVIQSLDVISGKKSDTSWVLLAARAVFVTFRDFSIDNEMEQKLLFFAQIDSLNLLRQTHFYFLEILLVLKIARNKEFLLRHE